MGKYSLIIVSTLIFGMITFSHGLKNNMLSSQMQLNQSYEMTQAQNIAQSSAMLMVNRIREGDSTYIPTATQTFYFPGSDSYESWGTMKGEYKVEIYKEGDTLTVVNSHGRLNQLEYEVKVKLDRTNPDWDPDLTHAVFAGSSIDLDGSATIVGNVGTNAAEGNSVDFDWSTNIDGNLQVGPGADIETTVNESNHSGNVEGEITNLPSELNFELPEYIEYPDKSNQAPSFDTEWDNTGTTLSPDYYDGKYIPSITIDSGWSLNIDTGDQDRTLYVGDLNIEQGDLNVTGDGKLTIIAEDNLTVEGSSTLNSNSGSSGDVFTYYGGTETLDFGGSTNFNSGLYAKEADINLNGSGGIQGHVITGGDDVTIEGASEAISRAVYAPNADVELTGSGSVKGSVIANTFGAGGATQVTFEEDHASELPDLKLGEGKMRVLSWN